MGQNPWVARPPAARERAPPPHWGAGVRAVSAPSTERITARSSFAPVAAGPPWHPPCTRPAPGGGTMTDFWSELEDDVLDCLAAGADKEPSS